MSKNISIKEGGTGRAFTARKLETALEGGGSCLWVPKDEVKRVVKSVDENGTYEATADGAYGYSALHVNVKGSGSATGKGTDGNEYTVTVDDLGELTETKVPTSIKITTPPNYTGPYGDGAIIGFDGIEVTAYDAEGNSMGVVPFSELVFPVTIARYDPEAGKIEYEATSELDLGAGGQPIPCSKQVEVALDTSSSKYVYMMHPSGKVTGWNTTEKYINIIYASDDPQSMLYKVNSEESPLKMNLSWTHENKTVRYGRWGFLNRGSVSPCYVNKEKDSYGEIAWTMVFGDISQHGGIPIPIQWPRPGDGKILSDTFDIEVVDVSPSTNDDESGNGRTL